MISYLYKRYVLRKTHTSIVKMPIFFYNGEESETDYDEHGFDEYGFDEHGFDQYGNRIDGNNNYVDANGNHVEDVEDIAMPA